MAGPWSIVLLGALWGGPGSVQAPDGPQPAHVHPVDSGPAIAFEEALGQSARAPALEGLAAAGEVKRALDRGIPRVVYGPQVNVMVGGRTNPAENRGLELQVTATQAWSLEGYGPKRHAAAEATTELLDARTRALALERELAAAHAWIMLHAAELELALARQELALARARVERLDAGRVAGVATRMQVAEARTDAAELDALAADLAGLVHDLGLVLARETGADAEHPLRTHGPHPEIVLPSDDELRRRFSAVERLPAVELERLRARALRAVAVEEKASRGHQAYAGLAFQREATSDTTLFGVVGMSFGGDRGQRHQATMAAEAREAEGLSEQRALELQAALSTVLHDLHHARERVEILRDRVLPTFDELELAQSLAVDLGEGTEAELLLARRRRIAVARRLVEADAVLVWARVQAWLYLETFVAAGVDDDVDVDVDVDVGGDP